MSPEVKVQLKKASESVVMMIPFVMPLEQSVASLLQKVKIFAFFVMMILSLRIFMTSSEPVLLQGNLLNFK